MNTEPKRKSGNDAVLADAVGRALHLSACLPQRAVLVSVNDGHVTLRGEVTWEYQRAAAATASRWLTGVTGVSNLIAVRARHSHKLDLA